jgi:hypothetical protein
MRQTLPLIASDITQVLVNAIEHNKIIASTMHFGEAKFA